MDAANYLTSTMCICGLRKKSGQSACPKCFYDIPKEERGDNLATAQRLLDASCEPFELERAPSTQEAPKTYQNTTGEQQTLFLKGSDWKPRHRDLFDVDAV